MSTNNQIGNVKVPGEMHRIDEERNTGVNLQRRDAELYIVLGIFMAALGFPVILGTYFTIQGGNFRPAVVNFVCGLVLFGIGVASILYGWVLKKGLVKF